MSLPLVRLTRSNEVTSLSNFRGKMSRYFPAATEGIRDVSSQDYEKYTKKLSVELSRIAGDVTSSVHEMRSVSRTPFPIGAQSPDLSLHCQAPHSRLARLAKRNYRTLSLCSYWLSDDLDRVIWEVKS